MQFLSYEISSSKLSLIVLRMVSGVVQEIRTCVKWSFTRGYNYMENYRTVSGPAKSGRGSLREVLTTGL